MKHNLLLATAIFLLPGAVLPCECTLETPTTFCATMDPSWYHPPDVIVLGVKLEEEAYGMHVRVLQVFQGDVAVDETLMVWGDNGACCRPHVGTWSNGDTVLWAFNTTDFMGNIIDPFGPQLEEEGDYCINGCGVYWLDHAAGMLSTGASWSGSEILPGITSMPLSEFWAAVMGCGAVGIAPMVGPAEPSVRTLNEGISISLPTPEPVVLQLTDAIGKVVLRRRWNGEPLWVGDLATGVFTATVENTRGRAARSVFVP